MNFFRSHIPRITLVLLLIVGVSMHYLQPVNKVNRYSAFTTWLSSHLKNNEDESVRKKIRDLGTSSQELEGVIRNASAFIEVNADDFKLDFQKTDQNEIFKHLLSEWISYVESQQGMAKGVVVTTAKAGAIQQNLYHSFVKAESSKFQLLQIPRHANTNPAVEPVNSIRESLLSDIIIGAP